MFQPIPCSRLLFAWFLLIKYFTLDINHYPPCNVHNFFCFVSFLFCAWVETHQDFKCMLKVSFIFELFIFNNWRLTEFMFHFLYLSQKVMLMWRDGYCYRKWKRCCKFKFWSFLCKGHEYIFFQLCLK